MSKVDTAFVREHWERNEPSDVHLVWQYVEALCDEVDRLRTGMRAIVGITSGSHATSARFAHDLAVQALNGDAG